MMAEMGGSNAECRIQFRLLVHPTRQRLAELWSLNDVAYPGSIASGRANRNPDKRHRGGRPVASVGGERGHNPVGVETWFARFPRVAPRLATLGWRTQSLWDCTRFSSFSVAVVLARCPLITRHS